MAIAGKVAITPKGEWNAQTAYTKLDLVFYENASYVAIQPSTGVEPTNESYWMLMVQSAGGADLEAIIDGTQQVGNAKTLDGHEAEYFAKETDLANYLPLTGGTINGSAALADNQGSNPRTLTMSNSIVSAAIGVWDNGTIGVHDNTGANWIFYKGLGGTPVFNGTANGNLPLTGGLVANALQTPIIVQNTTSGSNTTFIKYRGSQFDMGSLGFAETNVPAWINNDGSAWYPLLHTGNKPTGTYTGNGSATQRIIETGGTGEFALIKYGNTGFALLTSGGYIGSNGTAVIRGSDAYFASSKIILSTTNVIFNESGSTYKWQVL